MCTQSVPAFYQGSTLEVINFVTEPGRWVLRPICEEFARYLPATISTKPDTQAKVNVFVNYALYQSINTKTVGFFTHREKDSNSFDQIAQECDWCVAMCNRTAGYLPKKKTSIIQVWPNSKYIKDKIVFGVVGRQYSSGRKRFWMAEPLKEIEGIEVRFTNGEIPEEKMTDFYREIDYLLVLSNNEGGPVPVVEALGMGVPVIAPNVGFCWSFPVLRYETQKDLISVIKRLRIPKDGWQQSALQLETICRNLLTEAF